MLEFPEPSEDLKAALRHLDAVRGGFLSSYAQAEFLLADIYTKAVSRGWYEPETSSFPEKLRDRVAVCTTMFGRDGPFSPFAPDILPAVGHLLQFSELRQFLVHGHTTLLHDKAGNIGVQLRLYKWAGKKQGFQLLGRLMLLEQLESERDRLRLYVSTLSRQLREIYLATGLEAE